MVEKTQKMSRTKIGAVLIGLGAILGTVGAMVQGSVDVLTGIQALVQEVGAVAVVFGIRGLKIFNK